jgi:hypothetical protein
MAVKAARKRLDTAPTTKRPRNMLAARTANNRSAVTNGRKLFVLGDGNSAWSRRYRDLVCGHISDLGGASGLSEAQLSLIKRAAAIEVELEQQEGKLSQGQEINLDVFTRSASHLRRLWESLGLDRKAKDITTIDNDDAEVSRLLSYFEPDNETTEAVAK